MVYECFHCGRRAAVWQSDFNFEDYGFAGDGIVQVLECTNCGAEILYIIKTEEEKSDD